MASPLFELAAGSDMSEVDIEVVPGITAASASAALLGAPLGHDHAVMSLSDLLTPWEVIERRLSVLAESDMAIVLYNPRSSKRTEQFERALAILRAGRPPGTPAGLVTSAQREGQQVVVTTLERLDPESVTMSTCVVVGSPATFVAGGRMVTPRGYP
jgi:cobalt-precorrin 5A hydrolase/precorrin-3B C17-methyltransferase